MSDTKCDLFYCFCFTKHTVDNENHTPYTTTVPWDQKHLLKGIWVLHLIIHKHLHF